MSKSNSFTIYLLKKGYDDKNSLKKDHPLEKGVKATNLPMRCTLFVLDIRPRNLWWRSYFGISPGLNQASKGALIFLPVGERCFALSFGYVFHSLEETAYEHDFGLRVKMNSVDPERLKSVDSLEFGADRRQRTQVPVDSDLTFFDFDRDKTILKSLTGTVKDKHKDLFRHPTGSSSIRISSPLAANELPSLCEKFLILYESNNYKTAFPNFHKNESVRDPSLISQLNKKLLEAFRKKDENLHLMVPDIINNRENVYANFSGCGWCEPEPDVSIGGYYAYLEGKGKEIEDIGLDDFKKKYQLKLVDQDNPQNISNYSIMKCFVFDTSLPRSSGVYHLIENNWYKVEYDYIKKLQNDLDSSYEDLTLPVYDKKTEGAYNKEVADNDENYLCFDGKNISPVGQYGVEPCDLYAVQDKSAVFYHVKVSTRSALLSHLFNQGTNALQLLKSEQEARDKLYDLIDSSTVTGNQKENFKKPLRKQKYSVTYAIVTHKNKGKKSLNLPLFSRISLRSSLKLLKLMDVDRAAYGFVMNETKIKQIKRKSSKKVTNQELENYVIPHRGSLL